MKAAVVRSFDRPLEIEDVPDPRAGRRAGARPHRGVRASATPTSTPPAASGRSSRRRRSSPATRASASSSSSARATRHGLAVGDRVALPWLGYACGDCRYCNSGRETLCPHQLNTGYALNGGFAEYAVGYARHVVRVPDGIDPLDAAPLTCAGVTTYKAVKVSGATSADLVAVFGVGGLGHLADPVRRGSPAPPSSPSTPTRRGSRRRATLGAEHLVHVGEEDPIAAIQRLGGADVGDRDRRQPDRAFEQAIGSLARGGTLVCVGLPADNEHARPDLRDGPRRPRRSAARSSARTTTSRRSSSCTAAG